MKEHKVTYKNEYTQSPLSFWIHIPIGGNKYYDAKLFEHPLPKVIPCKGFPILLINVFGVELRFSSIPKVKQFLEIISQKHMKKST